jgi:hypothetical protein
MLLNKVIVGKGCKMMQDFTTLTGPPPGYDSVRTHVHDIYGVFNMISVGAGREGREPQL